MSALLEIQNITKRFGGLTAVDDLSFDVAEGEVLALLGPNGSGKTTMMNIISGALKPTEGRITLAGEQITGLPPHRVAAKGVARTFQLVKILPSLDVRENVIAALAFRRDALWGQEAQDEADRLLVNAGLSARGGEMVENLTYIDQKRVELARALASQPRLLLLDEWLAGLNPTELRVGIDLIAGLRDAGMTILLVEHVMEAVRALCNRCVVMNVGSKIADGDTDAVLNDPGVVRAYLGTADA
ncbi:ABC transporter ATP-binding protein [Puniceibacterium sediminis]|uniref:Amino acid/amide ABC transporter ATP-binding protein 1, HAAT family n=1 Tax=Puniceibacterium sediminis TaxID=1608407 RepID=A0A238Y6Q3_9RHOB|nr:ABC transporter ATP-binding protein [Puniceibacterium sediminis]SNR66632.1 amino acid/amide ABC transporter ATP-binding protein 1, HAAT family [Puniceibacterium sediminis]